MIIDTIKNDLKTAIKNGDKVKINILRVIIGESDRLGKNLPDAETLKVLKKISDNLLVINNDSAKAELKIVSEYLPKMLSKEEMDTIINKIKSENEGKSFGDLMKICIKECKGLGDNKYISEKLK